MCHGSGAASGGRTRHRHGAFRRQLNMPCILETCRLSTSAGTRQQTRSQSGFRKFPLLSLPSSTKLDFAHTQASSHSPGFHPAPQSPVQRRSSSPCRCATTRRSCQMCPPTQMSCALGSTPCPKGRLWSLHEPQRSNGSILLHTSGSMYSIF